MLNVYKFLFLIFPTWALAVNSMIIPLKTKDQSSTAVLKLDVQKLMNYYSPKAKWWQDEKCIHPGGCLGTEQSVWVWANATYVMASYQDIVGDSKYQSTIKNIYTSNWRHIYPKKYFDDDLWWALALLRVYEVTKDKSALDKAILLVKYVSLHGQQNICYGSGGVYWNLAKTEVGTIANMLYIIDTAKLYQITHDNWYKQEANTTWNWYRKSGLLKKNYIVEDHYATQNGKCGALYSWPFTYNVGIVLFALSSLADINHDDLFTRYGKELARASLKRYTADNGVINEYCDNVFECAKNVFLFKGIYAYDLALFALATNDPQFIDEIRQSLAYNLLQAKKMRANSDIYGFNWALPINYATDSKLYNPADILSHLSVVYLELANLLISEAGTQSLIKSSIEKK